MQLSVIGALQIYTICSLEGRKRLCMEHMENGAQNSRYTYLLARGAPEIHKLLIKGPTMGIHRMW